MVSRAFILLLLLLAAMFAAWKWWPAEYLPVIIFPGKEEPQPELTVQTIPQTREDMAYAEGDAAPTGNTLASPATDVQAQQKALDGIAAHIAGKGAQMRQSLKQITLEIVVAVDLALSFTHGGLGPAS